MSYHIISNHIKSDKYDMILYEMGSYLILLTLKWPEGHNRKVRIPSSSPPFWPIVLAAMAASFRYSLALKIKKCEEPERKNEKRSAKK